MAARGELPYLRVARRRARLARTLAQRAVAPLGNRQGLERLSARYRAFAACLGARAQLPAYVIGGAALRRGRGAAGTLVARELRGAGAHGPGSRGRRRSTRNRAASRIPRR